MSGIKTKTAPIVKAFLEAGARFVGKTHTDELAFSAQRQERPFRRADHPAAPGPHHRRLLLRLDGGGGGAARRYRSRLRYRRLGPRRRAMADCSASASPMAGSRSGPGRWPRASTTFASSPAMARSSPAPPMPSLREGDAAGDAASPARRRPLRPGGAGGRAHPAQCRAADRTDPRPARDGARRQRDMDALYWPAGSRAARPGLRTAR